MEKEVHMKGWLHTALVVGLGFLAFVPSGCAFGTRRATLQSPSLAGSPGLGVSSAEAAALPSARGKIVLVAFADQRSNKQSIGEVRNGWGMHTADVVPDRDIGNWITQSVKTALEQDGFQVLEADRSAASASTPVLSGDVLTVYCTAFFSYEGEVSFFVRIGKDGQQVLNNRYTGKGSAGLNLAATGSGYAQSLELALKDSLTHLMADLNVALH
jgi:hypothetical protein